MIQATGIFWPMIALASLTLIVLLIVPSLRIAAVQQGKAQIKDYRYGDTENVPIKARLANRNYINLLQMPVLFYVVCLMFFVTDTVTNSVLTLAWIFVASRLVHSMIHIGYNNITHRFMSFVISNLLLAGLWVMFAVQLPTG